MELMSRRVAGIDVHKRMLAVVVRRDQEGPPQYEKRKFGTTRKEIMALAAWLQHQQVTEVVMESTAQYWRPVWYGLEAHFQLHLSHPLQTRAPRGRKRDYRAPSGWRIAGGPAIWRTASFPGPNNGDGVG
jgi:hypothetical protein